jgi:hypothetical protein
MIGETTTREGSRMPTDWYMEGPYVKNCNCDPGCPCDFNQYPTHGHCEGMAAMRIDDGKFGDVDLSGLSWGAIYRWPGALHEGNGEIQPIVDEKANEEQRNGILQAMSGQHGGTFFEVLAVVAPNVKDPVFAPAEFEWNLEERTARVRFGDVLETETDTLRGIDPPDPYRILIKIPGGMEYTNKEGEADVAQAKTIKSSGAIPFDLSDGHSSLAWVRHGPGVETAEYRPTVVDSS